MCMDCMDGRVKVPFETTYAVLYLVVYVVFTKFIVFIVFIVMFIVVNCLQSD